MSLSRIQNLNFRTAINEDISAICAIHNVNVRSKATSTQHGFLLCEVTEDELLKKREEEVQYFVATGTSNEILGYVAVSTPRITSDFLEQVSWQDDTYKNLVTRDGNRYIQVVAVKPEHTSQGIARFLYESLYHEFPDSFFTAFVVTKPVKNLRSLDFHNKQGFQKIGTIQLEQFLDMKDYESVLLLKE